MSAMKALLDEREANITTVLNALDDYEQAMSDRFEETGDERFRREFVRASHLYDLFDRTRVLL